MKKCPRSGKEGLTPSVFDGRAPFERRGICNTSNERSEFKNWRAPHHHQGTSMGQIIPFQCQRRRRAPPAADAPSGQGAEILFFLGVRYCRDDNGAQSGGDEPKRPSSRSRRKKRA
jgi:hypothetical protein